MAGGRNPGAGSGDGEQLRDILQGLLAAHFGTGVVITRLVRRRSAYSSSATIEELEVNLADGRVMQLMFKDLSHGALLGEARRIKPGFLLDPRREIELYRSILSPSEFGTARCYGSIIDENKDRFWLFLEKIPGLELYQVGEFEAWRGAASWLAKLHSRFEGRTEKLSREVPLLQYDRRFYLNWLERARHHLAARPEVTAAQVDLLGRAYLRAIERLLSLPTTLLHGEFYPSNVMVQSEKESFRIRVLDWETAAAGPGVVDLAALVSGDWAEDQKLGLMQEYMHSVSAGAANEVESERFFQDVACGQLHLAMQWLGWSAEWSPPEEHRQDWLKAALEIADRLER